MGWRVWRVCASLALALSVPPKPNSVPLSSSPYEILGIPKRATLSQARRRRPNPAARHTR